MAHSGKSVLVTGGCGGLGRAIAENFLAQGANVVVCDINDGLIEEFNKEVASAHEGRVLALKSDITSEQDLDSLFQQAADKFNVLDYIINSAGIMDRFDPAGELDKALWDKVIAVNLTAPTMIIKRGVAQMMAKGVKGGAIVNISSIAGFKGFCAGTAYTVSKHGLIGLTKNTAAFYRSKGIRCNAICAGGMNTNITSAFMSGFNNEGMALMNETYSAEKQRSNLCDVNKVSKLVMYLCSDDAEIVNGSIYVADAGVTAN